MVVTIHKTQAKALGSDVQRSFKITCMFLRSWLSVRASEPCPIMISNRSKGLLRQIGARVDFLRKLRAIQHLNSTLPIATGPVPPTGMVRSRFFPHTPGLRNTPQINSANAATPTKNIIFHGGTEWGGGEGWVDIKRPCA